jgi:hypothetical protein
MKRFIASLLLTISAACAQTSESIPLAELKDRIAGGWAGQMIGVSYGAPTEFRYKAEIIPKDKLPQWKPEMINNSLGQDDLYVDMTFAKVLEDKGLNATTDDFGAMFREAKYMLWHANLASRRALKRGVPATLAGTPKYNVHANDIDFQIEADFIGVMTPGMPNTAIDIGWRAGRVMNYGDGIYGGIFVSCMYAEAFFEKDPHKVVEAGLACLPAKSPYAMLITDLLKWHGESPADWTKVWQLVQDKYDRRDPCPDGALAPYNIDAKLNGAYIAFGLLFGDGDMGKTIEISTRAGQDSDCNPSSAAGILGVMMGYKAIPDVWKSGIPAIADKKFSYTNYSFNTIVESSYNQALKVIAMQGGKVETDRAIVKTQRAKAAKLELWDDYGSPMERIKAADAKWKFEGAWQEDKGTKFSSTKGASAEIAFNGTGVIVVGPYFPDGGKADVFFDGKLVQTVDVYPDEDSWKGGESVWHAFKLKPGQHTVKVVVRGETYPGSKGARIGISDLVVFR